MKISISLFLGVILALPNLVNAEVTPPEFTAHSAKHARLKAMQRALISEYDEDDDLPEVIVSSGADSGGCDLNVGNVIIDEDASPEDVPDEVIIIIEGDFLQSNNCR